MDTHDALEQIQLLDTESQDRRKILLGKPDNNRLLSYQPRAACCCFSYPALRQVKSMDDNMD